MDFSEKNKGPFWKLVRSVPDCSLDPLPPVPLSASEWATWMASVFPCPFTNLCLSHSLSLSTGAHRESQSFPGSAQTFIGPEKEVGGATGCLGWGKGREKLGEGASFPTMKVTEKGGLWAGPRGKGHGLDLCFEN